MFRLWSIDSAVNWCGGCSLRNRLKTLAYERMWAGWSRSVRLMRTEAVIASHSLPKDTSVRIRNLGVCFVLINFVLKSALKFSSSCNLWMIKIHYSTLFLFLFHKKKLPTCLIILKSLWCAMYTTQRCMYLNQKSFLVH